MASVYDPDSDERRSPEGLRRAEEQANADQDKPTKADGASSGLAAAEQRAKTPGVDEGALGLKRGGDDGNQGFARRAAKGFKALGNALYGNNKRRIITGALVTALVGGTLSFGSLFTFLNVFKLDHFMSAIEQRGFARYQVDMDGRSSKWLAAYMAMRFAEVEDDKVAPADRDNVFFRSNKVDNNQPLRDWYRTLRASRFEQDVFNKHGIVFRSVATRNANGGIDFRSAMISINGAETTFDLSDADRAAIVGGDSTLFNTRLSNEIDAKIFQNDKEARKAIKKVVDENVKPWQWFKRRQMRRDIQNMIGVRDWKFFENTRNKIEEKKIDMRNRFIKASFPEDTKSGKFIQCVFGIAECKSSSDPASPESRSGVPTADGEKDGGKQAKDENGNPVDTSGTDTAVKDAADTALNDTIDKTGKTILQKVVIQIVDKFSAATGIVSAIDSISRIDGAIQGGALVTMVTVARSTQAAGMYTTMSTARDQMKTGEANPYEINTLMSIYNGIGNNAVYSNVISKNDTNAPLQNTQQKQQYCDPEHQQNVTDGEYAQLCDSMRIGGESTAKDITDWWNKGPIGTLISPVLKVWRETVGGPIGWINNFLGDVTGFFTGPLIDGILKATGLDATLQDAMGWLIGQIAQQLGAGPMSNGSGAADGMLIAEGAAYTAESSMRYQGAPQTTPETKEAAIKSVIAYNAEKDANQSFDQKYLALDNPDSLASTQLFALLNNQALTQPGQGLGGIASILASLPINILGLTKAHADSTPDPYGLSTISGIDTYDFPAQCLDTNVFDMTPQNSTNAAQLGLIPENELTWDLLRNKEKFYDRLYQSNPTDAQAKQVYNCALLDNGVQSALGGGYGWQDDHSVYDTAEDADAAPPTGAPANVGTLNPADLAQSSVNTPCVAGTTDVGIQTGYANGAAVQIRLCAIPGLPSTGDESSAGGKYAIAGAGGLALVNSKVSANVLQMVAAAKAAGINITAGSSFRSNQHQADLYAAQGAASAARPGYSNHQMGLAIDFNIVPGGNNIGNCKTVNGVCTPPSDPNRLYQWLVANSKTYSYEQLNKEFWHWEPIGV